MRTSVACRHYRSLLLSIVLLGIAGCATRSPDDSTYALADAIFFINARDIDAAPGNLVWNLPTRALRNSVTTGIALEMQAAPGWVTTDALVSDDTLELYVLEGALQIDTFDIAQGDYLRFEAGKNIPPMRSTVGATFLVFSDSTRPSVSLNEAPTAGVGWTHVRGEQAPWVGGTAMQEAGREDVPLRIKHFRNDPITGARTYLVAVSPGLSIPWEVHDVAEEAYILEGDFTLPECLASGMRVGRYAAGGYFYRPPDIAHNGPLSGTETGVIMLIRTSGPLTVKLVEGCDS